VTARPFVPRAPAQEASRSSEPLIRLSGITKRFPGILANDNVALELYRGEVHALLGENGAGKSTLVKILYGFYQADSGEIRYEGTLTRIQSPHDARTLRIGMVFQDFTLIPAMTVVENIALFLPNLTTVLNKKQIARRIEEFSDRYQLMVKPWAPIWQLSVGERQKIELLKLLLADTRTLIFDEPTKVLAPHEIEGLFSIFANLRRDGYSIVFITHKLPEVLACADRITVMRHGRVTGTLFRAEADENTLVTLMFGAAPTEPVRLEHESVAPNTLPLLELRDIKTKGHAMATSLKDINLQIMPGEIVGVAGVSGNGQKELGDVILGLDACAGGSKYLSGQDTTRWSVAQVRASGVAFIPEDPLSMAAVPMLTVRENMALGNPQHYDLVGGLSMNWLAVQQEMAQSYDRLGLTVPAGHVPVRTLSGGQLQRLILARELARTPRLILAFYPTRGLDVPSAMAVRHVLLTCRDNGAGVLLISEDLGELFSLSDRLLVLYQGSIVGQFRPEEISMNEIGQRMTGASTNESCA
jgi:ABC-type uncharacterized transport system ATPase subunit